MNQNLIFAPMGALAALTFAVLGLVPIARFRAVFAGKVQPDDFKLGESPAVPADVSLFNRNYMNLLDLPTLFYAICLMFFVTGRVTGAVLSVAWVFVGLRLAHSLIHITYNHVFHRLSAFTAATAALSVLWLMFFLHP